MSAHTLRVDPVVEFARSRWLRLGTVPFICVLIAVFLVWAAVARLDEVAMGSGKVTPSSRLQFIQSLEGGIVERIFVAEGDIVENLDVTTIGGVVQPGGVLMEIVPIEDRLLIEARISPRDIAFIRPRPADHGEDHCLRPIHLRHAEWHRGANLPGYAAGRSPA